MEESLANLIVKYSKEEAIAMLEDSLHKLHSTNKADSRINLKSKSCEAYDSSEYSDEGKQVDEETSPTGMYM